MSDYRERRREHERRRRKKEIQNADIGLHDVRAVLLSGPARFPIVFGCFLALICMGSAGGVVGFIFAAIEVSPVFYAGAVLFAVSFAFGAYLFGGLWWTCDQSGLEAAVIRVNGPSQLAGQTLTIQVLQEKRKPLQIKAITIHLFIGRVRRQPNSSRGWKFDSDSIEFVDSLGKLFSGKGTGTEEPFHNQTVADSFGTDPVDLTLSLDIPSLSARQEENCRWGLRVTTMTDGNEPDCKATYYLPDPVPKWIVTGPERRICGTCKNEYTEAMKQDELYVVSGSTFDGPTGDHGDRMGSSSNERYTDYYQVYRCPHCQFIVEKKPKRD